MKSYCTVMWGGDTEFQRVVGGGEGGGGAKVHYDPHLIVTQLNEVVYAIEAHQVCAIILHPCSATLILGWHLLCSQYA